MDFEQFQQQIIEEMRDRFPDLHIDTQEVTKLQGQSYTGIDKVKDIPAKVVSRDKQREQSR